MKLGRKTVRILSVGFLVGLVLSSILAVYLEHWSRPYRREARSVDLSVITIPEAPTGYTQSQVRELLSKWDPGFYDHNGTDFGAIAKSLILNIGREQARAVPGTQTISYDLALELLPHEGVPPARRYTHLYAAFFLAHRVEDAFTKDEILKLFFHHTDPTDIEPI